MQSTLRREVPFPGIGLHTGRPVRMIVRPAGPEHGIWFKRTDVTDSDPMIQAAWDQVTDTSLNTTIGNAHGVTVSTVEHVMAALAGCGIWNALIEIDGPEVPIMDGSAARFVAGFRKAGIRRLNAVQQVIRVRRSVSIEEGPARAWFEPASLLRIRFEIDFPDAAIGRQWHEIDLQGSAFTDELADSRTFCRRAEIDEMRKRGLAKGGTLENAVVVDGSSVLNPEGFRHPDECVRHKMLDVVGDLALAGAPILGRYVGIRAGHAVTNRLLRKLIATEGAVEIIPAPARGAGLPGFVADPALGLAV